MTLNDLVYWLTDAFVKAVTFEWLQMTIAQFLVVLAIWCTIPWEGHKEYKKREKIEEETGEPMSSFHFYSYWLCWIAFAAPFIYQFLYFVLSPLWGVLITPT